MFMCACDATAAGVYAPSATWHHSTKRQLHEKEWPRTTVLVCVSVWRCVEGGGGSNGQPGDASKLAEDAP